MDGYCFITKTTGTGRADDPAKKWAREHDKDGTIRIYYGSNSLAVVMDISATEVTYKETVDVSGLTDEELTTKAEKEVQGFKKDPFITDTKTGQKIPIKTPKPTTGTVE
ncbi:MAG: hypothetical protein WC208_15320 [Gallionella sp.]|jgi:hypothetical protein